MKNTNNIDDNFFKKYDKIKFLNNKRNINDSNTIHKIPIFITDINNAYYLSSDNLNKNLFCQNYIFATIVNNECVREIVTGKIFPIYNLYNNSYNCDEYRVKENSLCLNNKNVNRKFAISINNFLIEDKFELEQLENYLTFTKDAVYKYLNCVSIPPKFKVKIK